jgi:hypothetical protein
MPVDPNGDGSHSAIKIDRVDAVRNITMTNINDGPALAEPVAVRGADAQSIVQLQVSIFEDLEALRLSADDTAGLTGTRERLLHVPVSNPNRHVFFRTHPDPAMSLVTTIFEDKDAREMFFVVPEMRGALLGETKPVWLTAAITVQGVVMIFPVGLPTDGRSNPWLETKRQAAELAKTRWVRMVADMQLGAYRIYEAEGELPDPVWPGQPLRELLEIAFKGRIIDHEDHPLVRRLRGLA